MKQRSAARPATAQAVMMGVTVVGLLAGCATPPAPDHGPPWTSGRLSVRVQAHGDTPAHSASASFELRGTGRSGELNLSSPLGLRLASARWTATRVVLDTGEGEREYTSLDALSRQALGEVLPLAALPDWLAGRPWTEAPHLPLEAGFEQLGWRVSLARYGEGLVEAQRAEPPAIVLRARIDAGDSPARP